MASPTVDRRLGLVGSVALKAPVTVVAAANIILAGEQTIDGIAVQEVNGSSVPDRVLCVAQDDPTENGIWNVSTGSWRRAVDANGPHDLVKGTTVFVTDGTDYGGWYFQITSDGPILPGTSEVTWTTVLTEINQAGQDALDSAAAAAQSAQEAQEDAQATAADRVQTGLDVVAAEAARDAAIALMANTGEAVVDALIGDETSAIAISALAGSDYAVKVVDAANPLNNKVGSIRDVLGSLFTVPKMVIAPDRRTLRWSPHNFAKATNDPGANVTGGTTVAAQDIDGGMEAATITATSATQCAFRQQTLSGSGYTGIDHMVEWVVKAGTAPHGFVGFHDGASYYLAYFNTSTWVLGTVASGLTAAIHTTRADGTALPTGYRRITAYMKKTTTNTAIYCGPCDADGAYAVTIGRTITAEKPHLHLGVQSMDYFENTGTSLRVGVAVDYSRGGPRILIEPIGAYVSRHSNDLTQSNWVKDGITPAFTATGPDRALCSTLTATTANGTCLQTTPANANQVASAFIKRRTGTGTIEFTADNGATWTDVTALINSDEYTRVWLTATSNSAFGFRVGTSGDEIDVAYAIIGADSVLHSPYPVANANISRAADSFIVPLSLMTAGTEYSMFVDYERAYGMRFPDSGSVRIGKADLTQEMLLHTVSASGQASMNIKDGTLTKDYKLWQLTSGERLQVSMKIEANQHMMSINGDPSAWTTTCDMPAMEQARLAYASPVYLRSMLIVPRAVDRDELRTWRWSMPPYNKALWWETAAYDRDPLVPNITMNRDVRALG
jgi:hypothetical protein